MKGKIFLCLALVTSMLLSVFMIGPVSAPSTTFGVEPDSIIDPGLGPGSTFTVEIWVRDVEDLAGLEFKLGYDTTVLTADSIAYGDIFGTTYWPLISEIHDDEGYLWYAVMEALGEPSFYGDGRAAIIDFTVDSVGESALDLYDTKLGDSSYPPVPIVHDVLDGYFSNVGAVVGWVEGTVTDADTLLPIEGATVSADGVSDVTDSSGFYSIEVSPGTYDVTAEMAGYLSQTATMVVVADTTTIQDFALSPAPLATFGVEPDSIIDPGLGPGSTFTVEIWVRDVEDLRGLEFKLGYDTTVLTADSIAYGDIFGTTYWPLISEIHDDEGYLFYAVMEALGEPSFYGDGRAAIIDFTVDSVGESVLDLYDTKLGASDVTPIVHDALDGYFSNTEALEELIDTIKNWNLPRGTENSLTSKLEGALHLLDIGNENGAIHKLMDFIKQVEAHRGKKLTNEQADQLISEAQRIVDLIEG